MNSDTPTPEVPDLLAALQKSINNAKKDRTAHDHAEHVPGCFRCDLSRNEVTPNPEGQS